MRTSTIFSLVIPILLTSALAIRMAAQTPSAALLVLEKGDQALAIVDPEALKVVGRVPAGADPHEVVASDDGRFAYISNYGAFSAPQHTISVVDLVEQKALPAIDLGALIAPVSNLSMGNCISPPKVARPSDAMIRKPIVWIGCLVLDRTEPTCYWCRGMGAESSLPM